MNRSMFKTLGKLAVGTMFAFALATTNIGCHKGGCEPCKTSKGCASGCDKPCCKKVEKTSSPCPAGCAKPCCKRT